MVCIRNFSSKTIKIKKYKKKNVVQSWNVKPNGEIITNVDLFDGFIGRSKSGKFAILKQQSGIKCQFRGKLELSGYIEINQAIFVDIAEVPEKEDPSVREKQLA